MFILNKFTWNSISKNKKRTLVTLIGVILSCALICGTVILGESLQDMLIQTTIMNTGNYDVLFNNVDFNKSDLILNDKQVKESTMTKSIGYAKLEGSVNEHKPYLYLDSFDKQAFETFNVRVIKGRLPKSSTEIVISEHIIDNAQVDMNIGETLTLNIGERRTKGDKLTQNARFRKEEESFESLETTKEYKIVGIIARMDIEPAWAAGYTVLTMLDKTELTASDKVRVFTTFSNPRKVYEIAPLIAEKTGLEPEDIKYNSELLRMKGISNNRNVNKQLRVILAVLIVLIIVASVALIFNSFAISVTERKKQFGLLKSIGATPKQIRKIVYKEAAIIGAVAMPIGILCGILGIWAVLLIANNLLRDMVVRGTRLNLIVSPYVIISTILFLGVTLLVSAWIPARRAARVSPIDNIRQSEDIKIKNRKRNYGSKLVTQVFGFEADLANKSIKRNRKKYRITVFSLAISIVMFIVFSSFISGMFSTVGSVYEQNGYNILINGTNIDHEKAQEIVSMIKPGGNVEQATMIRKTTVGSPLEREKFNDFIFGVFEDMIDKDGDKYIANIALVELNDKDFKLYLQEQGLDAEDYFDPSNPKGIYVKKSRFIAGRVYEIPVLEIDTGDKIIDIKDNERNIELQVGAVVTETPFAVPLSGTNSTVMVSKAVGDKILKEFFSQPSPYNIAVQAHKAEQFENYFVGTEIGKGLMVVNYDTRESMNNRMNILIALLCYGFISIITLIGVTNIFNTINTNIMLRRREFAMLKSVGLTPRGFDKMLNFESMLYGLGAIIWALPIGLFLANMLNRSFNNILVSPISQLYALPWKAVLQSGLFVIVLVFVITRYSLAKIKNENIIDALRSENI